MAGKQGVVLLATLVLATVFGVSSAKTVTVGGNTGWTIPPSPSFYTTWASGQTFAVGDKLVFNFPVNAHTVAEVSKANFDSCTTTSTIGAVMTTGPATMTLTAPGTHYFICTIPGHCGSNQKVAVTVAAASVPTPGPKASPAPKKAPTPAPKMAPTPAPMMSPPTMAPTPAPMMAPTPAPMMSPPTMAPTSAPMMSPPTAPSATPPMPTVATPPGGEASSPSGGAASAPPPAGSAASTGVTLLSLLSVVTVFLVC